VTDTFDMTFKQLTANNWERPDETSANFVRVSPVVGS
jgi:hypothetical protein